MEKNLSRIATEGFSHRIWVTCATRVRALVYRTKLGDALLDANTGFKLDLFNFIPIYFVDS